MNKSFLDLLYKMKQLAIIEYDKKAACLIDASISEKQINEAEFKLTSQHLSDLDRIIQAYIDSF